MENVITSMDQLFVLIMGSFGSIMGTAFLYTLMGLVIAIVLMIFVKQKKWARREQGFWNVMTSFHYVFILLAFLVTAPLLGGTRAVHTMTNELVNHYLGPTIEEQVNLIQEVIVSSWPEKTEAFTASTEDTVHRLVKAIRYNPESDGFFEGKKAEVVNWLIDDLGVWIVGATVTVMASIAMGDAVESMGFGDGEFLFPLQQIEKMDYSQSGQQIAQSVNVLVVSYVDSFFNGFYLNLFFFLILLMSIPIVEISFFNLWWKKRLLIQSRQSRDLRRLSR